MIYSESCQTKINKINSYQVLPAAESSCLPCGFSFSSFTVGALTSSTADGGIFDEFHSKIMQKGYRVFWRASEPTIHMLAPCARRSVARNSTPVEPTPRKSGYKAVPLTALSYLSVKKPATSPGFSKVFAASFRSNLLTAARFPWACEGSSAI